MPACARDGALASNITDNGNSSLEASFSQDLNSDGTTGLVTSSIESAGSTTLTKAADAYFINYGSSRRCG